MNFTTGHNAKAWLAGVILTVAVLLGGALASCVYDESVRQMREETGVDESDFPAITFSNGVIDNSVRTRAYTLLSDHTGSMGVWGWQTTQGGVTERLFLNQKVVYNTSAGKWTYNPVKYWENNSTYCFCAYAPHESAVPGAQVRIDDDNLAISITGVTLHGDNTITNGVPELPGVFNHVSDVDWMVDRNSHNYDGSYRDEVEFVMEHVLSRMCISVQRGATLPGQDAVTLRIDSLKIADFASQADFRASNSNDSVARMGEWMVHNSKPHYTMQCKPGVTIPDTAVYIIESLMFPQPTRNDQTLKIWYSIGREGGYQNKFCRTFYLSDIFQSFMPGHSYLIYFTIGPSVITFDSGVDDWESHNAGYVIN